MAHQAIYRKWRPMTFNDVVGQSHITRTLKNQITSGAVGHAYLFCGTRGTGKTTCAKILSRAVNCLNPQDGNPCNECEVCRGIIDGSIMDVSEIDAASNNGVDNIREIKDDINYVASNSKYTVYIIDEVHMLSTGAFNALLKTLEEPPENVIFILATTESHKVPQTILSRCQRFDFKRIRNDDIIVRMKEIAYADGYEISDSAYRMLASLADGSMRDGLSVMERVISASGAHVDEEDIINALGISSQDTVFEMTDAIVNADSAAAVDIIDRIMSEGKELGQFAASMLSHFRSLMLCQLSGEPQNLLDCDSNTLLRLKSQSGKLSFERINYASSVITKAINDAKTAKSARIIYELAFIRLTKPELDNRNEAVIPRLEQLEAKMSFAGLGQNPSPAARQESGADTSELMRRIAAVEAAIKNGATPQVIEEPEPVEKTEKKVSHRLYVPIPEDELNYDYPTARLARNWNNTVETMAQQNKPFIAPLKNCVVTFDAEGLIVLVPDGRDGFTQRISMTNIDKIRELFRSTTGTSYNIKIAKRSDLDDSRILNPFDLKRSEGGGAANQPEPVRTVDAAVSENDKFDKFIERFSSIITDGDRLTGDFDREKAVGEQSTMDMYEDDDREEFLADDELNPQDDDSFI